MLIPQGIFPFLFLLSSTVRLCLEAHFEVRFNTNAKKVPR